MKRPSKMEKLNSELFMPLNTEESLRTAGGDSTSGPTNLTTHFGLGVDHAPDFRVDPTHPL